MGRLAPDDDEQDALETIGETLAGEGITGRAEIDDACAAMVVDLGQRYPGGPSERPSPTPPGPSS